MPEFLKGWEILIILVLLVLLFGAKRLPDAARGLGRSLRIFKAETKGMRDDETDHGDRAHHPGRRRARSRPGRSTPPRDHDHARARRPRPLTRFCLSRPRVIPVTDRSPCVAGVAARPRTPRGGCPSWSTCASCAGASFESARRDRPRHDRRLDLLRRPRRAGWPSRSATSRKGVDRQRQMRSAGHQRPARSVQPAGQGALAAGIFLASPVWLYQLWAFVTPGAAPQRAPLDASAFLVAGVPLFFAGAALCY